MALNNGHRGVIEAAIIKLLEKSESFFQGEYYTGTKLQDIFGEQWFTTFRDAVKHVTRGNASYQEVSHPQGGNYYFLRVQTNGGRRNRTYLFELDEVGPAINQEGYGSTGSNDGSHIEVEDSNPPASIRTNDYDEDRRHIAAHVALLMQLSCIGFSQKKTTKRGVDDNPDIVGIIRGSDNFDFQKLDWTNRPSAPGFMFVGAEVKILINNAGEAYSAIREARHNTRFFDSGYLISEIHPSIREEVVLLAEEYEIGVIAIDSVKPWLSTILHHCPPRRRQSPLWEYANREGTTSTFQQMRTKAHDPEAFPAPNQGRLFYLLNMLFSDQENRSLVPRLPKRVQDALKFETGVSFDQDTRDFFAKVAIGVMLDAYETADESSIDDFVKSLDPAFPSSSAKNKFFSSALIKTALLKRVLDLKIELRESLDDVELLQKHLT